MPLIRINEEVLKLLVSRKHQGQTYSGVIEELLRSGASSSQANGPVRRGSVSLDSLVVDFGRDCEREVRGNFGWKSGLAWALQWWEKQLGGE